MVAATLEAVRKGEVQPEETLRTWGERTWGERTAAQPPEMKTKISCTAMISAIVLVLAIVAAAAVEAATPIPSQCSAPKRRPMAHTLPANSATTHWGYTWAQNKPKLVVNVSCGVQGWIMWPLLRAF